MTGMMDDTAYRGRSFFYFSVKLILLDLSDTKRPLFLSIRSYFFAQHHKHSANSTQLPIPLACRSPFQHVKILLRPRSVFDMVGQKSRS